MELNEFRDLLDRYKQGKCTEEEARRIAIWYSKLGDEQPSDVSPEEQDEIGERIRQHIFADDAAFGNSVYKAPGLGRFKWYWAAASLVFLAFAGSYFLNNRVEKSSVVSDLLAWTRPHRHVKRENKSDKPLEFVLPDQSTVILLPKSEISYSETFSDTIREVSLKGGAFFSVKRDTLRPFFVYNGKLVTQVLGTSFWVKTNKSKKALEVEVVSGIVRVFNRGANTLNGKSNELVLTANGKAAYSERGGNLTEHKTRTGNVDFLKQSPAPVNMRFSNVTLAEICAALEAQFDIETIMTQPQMINCRFTGDVSSLPLTEVLDLISKSIGGALNYEFLGNRIIFYGEGC